MNLCMQLKSAFMLEANLPVKMVIFGNQILQDGVTEIDQIEKVMLLVDGKEIA